MRGWQAGHRSIVAPLAGAVVVGVAASVLMGAAMAKAERDRRGAKLRRRERQLGLQPGEPLAGGLQRMALAQADHAIELLGGGHEAQPTSNGAVANVDAPSLPAGASDDPHSHDHLLEGPDADAVHETRKALKRLRALVRLLAEQLGQDAFERENGALRDVGRRLSGARDAEVMLATFDALIERQPRKLARSSGVRRLRKALAAEHEQLQRETLGDPATLGQALGELHEFRARASAWSLSQGRGIDLVGDDLQRLYRQGRRRARRAARSHGRDARAMHEWRKRVKDLRYAAEMLNRTGLARRADQLGETLGEDHDLAVLAQRIREQSKRAKGRRRVARRTRTRLLKVIAKRRRKLQRRALRDGRRLYRQSPKKFLRRARRRARSRL